MAAVSFANKVFCVVNAVRNSQDYDYVVWIDGDTFSFRPIPMDFFEKLLPQDTMLTYLGRENPKLNDGGKYPECGFVGYNLTNKHTQRFVKELRNTYEQDLLFNEKQWHDSYVWNEVRKRTLNGQPQMDLTGRRKDGHVWPESKIAPYTAHLKGKRKKDAGVDERDKEINKEYYEGR